MTRNQYQKIRRKHLYNLSKPLSIFVKKTSNSEDQQQLHQINSENRRSWHYNKNKN